MSSPITGNPPADYADLSALFINCTLKRSPEPSNTDGLARISRHILESNGVQVDSIRAVDHLIATGVWPDMTEHGWDVDEWPAIYERVMRADIWSCAADLVGRQQFRHEAGDRAAVRLLEHPQRCRASTPTTGASADA